MGVKVLVSKKVLSLFSMTSCDVLINKKPLPKQAIQCLSNTTIAAILDRLNLSHLTHLIKICYGSGAQPVQEITRMEQKVADIPNLLSDDNKYPVLSILFSARWFSDESAQIAALGADMSQAIERTVHAAKQLKSCTSFARLDHQFGKNQAFILGQFEHIDELLRHRAGEIDRATRWFDEVIEDNVDRQFISIEDCLLTDAELESMRLCRRDALKWLQHLRNKVSNIDVALQKVSAKWAKKRKQIVLYLQKTVRFIETELMTSFRSWISSDIVQWLHYMDDRIEFSEEAQKQLLYLNGYNLSKVNDLSLQLMGVEDADLRELILGYIGSLLTKYGGVSPCSSCDTPHSVGCGLAMAPSEEKEKEKKSDNLCCICVSKEVNTVIAPCGHAAYCSECADESIKYCDRCPVCRVKVSSIITVYKAGLQL